jgi:hypothetical protein
LLLKVDTLSKVEWLTRDAWLSIKALLGRRSRWNKRQRMRGRIPRGAYLEATWTYSAYHGWVLGYSYEVVVTAGKKSPV